jgi:hypothetical protein
VPGVGRSGSQAAKANDAPDTLSGPTRTTARPARWTPDRLGPIL